MAKYLIAASYTPDGIPGLLEDGGTVRVAKVTEMVENLGGTVEAFYFAFGDTDAYVIVDIPDPAVATAVSLAVNGSGAVVLETTVLMTPEEMDEAVKQTVGYRPPGA